MKKGLIFVLFALVSIVSYSQVSWNAKVGMNMSNITGDADTNMKVGFNVGFGAEYAFTETWSVQPSLMLTSKGYKVDGFKCNPMYLELPVLAAARFAVTDNQNVVVKAGPYFAVGVAGKYKLEAGLGVGVAYEINRIFIDLTGEFGLTKIGSGDGAPKNMNFSIGLGYKF